MQTSAWNMPRRQYVPILLVVAATLTMQHWATPRAVRSDDSSPATPAQANFKDWEKPTLALFITGQQHGYIEPCGCTGLENQKGGLARRDQLLQELTQDRGWSVLPLDAGNQVRRNGPQAVIKFESTLRALRMMKYQAVGLGEDDLKLSSGDLLSEIVAQTDSEDKSDLFVSANVNLLGFVRPYRVIEHSGLRIGVTSVLGDDESKTITKTDELVVKNATAALKEAVAQMRADKCNFIVALANSSEAECKRLAAEVDGLDLMVCADGIGEPKYQPEQIKRTDGTFCALIQTGAKGMHVGVVGLFFGDRPSFRYQRVALDKTLVDSRRMLDSLKQYQQTLEDVLRHQGAAQLSIQPVDYADSRKYVGSETCGECHTQAFAKWETTGHAHATKSISEPTQRAEIARNFDPECISCHVTGWNAQNYYPYKSGYDPLTQSPHLLGNGCENCHGPGADHAAAEQGTLATITDADKTRLRQQMRLELSKAHEKCLECHDVDNSPDFHAKESSFAEYWEKVKHPGLD